MEKQRIKPGTESCRRLLSFILFLFIWKPAEAQVLTNAVINNLLISPVQNQKLYAKEDLNFEVFIPFVKANQVQVQNPGVIDEVTFKQLKKYDAVVEETNGVKIELSYSFAKKGEYVLPSLSVIIQNRKRNIKFAPVTILTNPADMNPRIVITFSNGQQIFSDSEIPAIKAVVGQKISFTVNLQFAVQLISFDYDIPKDSIFTQTKVFDILEIKYREKKYTDELIPVAAFDWTGLMAGQQVMPGMKLSVTAYNGYRMDCIMPEFCVLFEQEDFAGAAGSPKSETLFDDAFDFTLESENKTGSGVISANQCEILAKLRVEERNSLFNYAEKCNVRQKYEEQLELPASENEFCAGLFYISLVVLLFSIVVLVFFAKKHFRNATILFSLLVICFAALFVYTAVRKSETYGIFKGGKISSIPEQTAESFSEIKAGNRVRVSEKAGQWYYIELGETVGWCKAENLIIIK